MKWCFIITVIFPFSFSCNKKPDIPSEILKPGQMQDIIWDMMRSDSYADVLRQKDTLGIFPKMSMSLTDEVLAFHNTNRSQVEESFTFYSSHPEILKNILDSLNAQQTRKNIPELIKPPKPVTTHLR